jgi:hypothetical protein
MAIGGGTFSVLGGGKFSNGAFAGAMTHLYNAEGVAHSFKNGISYLANGIQFFAGAALTYTGIGSILGIPMMAHAGNNIYETYTGNQGYVRSGEEAIGLNYDYIDIGVSVGSGVLGATKQIGIKTVNYWNSNAITGYAPIYNYSTLGGKANIAVGGAGVTNTAYGINRE